jgi:hypothetical protein
MQENIINFLCGKESLGENLLPEPIAKSIPDWYKKADKYLKDSLTGELIKNENSSGPIPTWKSCPGLFDIMSTGYSLKTPCDVFFFINDFGRIDCKILDEEFKDFCRYMMPMPQFQVPYGCDEHHFSWNPVWGIELPQGYSALFIQPQNRFDLPFICTSGILDGDRLNFAGPMPFFLPKGWVGTIPAGTVYYQIFPFKRDDWKSKITFADPLKNNYKIQTDSSVSRIESDDFYKKTIWKQKKYD